MPKTCASRTVTLAFRRGQLTVGDDSDIREGLSAVALQGEHLWLACDEGCRLERLTRGKDGSTFADHHVFPLNDLLTLPSDATAEADIEGIDVGGGWLWLVGSHSVKRKKARKGDAPSAIASKLARTDRDGNRHLLARVPLDSGEPRRESGNREAGRIAASTTSSALLDAIRRHNDPHLAPFVEVPGKDNGFDIEGLAVRGLRVFLGLRGPVLRGWCCILELKLEADGQELRLTPIDGGVPYRKHFLKLDGLGVRDLLVLDNDVLILAGPSMSHDGPTQIWRWKNGAKAKATPSAEATRVLALPERSDEDKAEAFTVLDEGRSSPSVLVVFDSPAQSRLRRSAVSADVYRLR
jgi:hypothetical protein